MTDAHVPADLDDPLDEAPLFFVEPVPRLVQDRKLSEISRAVIFRRLMRTLAPSCSVDANANAGKRNPRQAMREGVKAGLPDYTIAWPGGGIAFVELKGFSSGGRPGKLSPAQIAWGNRMVRLGHHVACFYEPLAAIAWLGSLGAPIREAR